MLDPRKPAGQQMKLYAVPFPYFFPYDAHYDEQGYTWTGGIYADRVARMNVETGEWNFYLLPFEANIRDINLRPADAQRFVGALDRPHASSDDHADRAARALITVRSPFGDYQGA